MAPPQVRKCYVPDCQYKTPENLNTLELQIRDLELHLKGAHHELGRANDSLLSQGGAGAAKPDKLPRPTLEEGITEADWVWFEERWTRYKRSTGLDGQNVIDHLWACATDGLARRCYDAGNCDKITEKNLLQRMKKMSIRAQNKLVNIVEFLSMTQNHDEPVAQFISRLHGQAKVCDFSIKCTAECCENNDSMITYADNMVSHQLVRGLQDTSVQEKVLALAATDKDLNLKKISEFVEAQETGSRSSKLLGGAAGINVISDYKKKNFSRPAIEASKQNEQDKNNENDLPCNYCGYFGHGTTPKTHIRQTRCPAFGKACSKCGELGHFGKVCRQKKESSNKESVEAQAIFGVGDSSDDDNDDNIVVYAVTTGKQRPKPKKDSLYSFNSKGRAFVKHISTDKSGKWINSCPESLPSVSVTMSVSESGYYETALPRPVVHKETRVRAIPDTAAQITLAGTDLIDSMNISRRSLIQVSQRVKGVSSQALPIIGALLLDITGQDKEGHSITSRQLVYIAKGAQRILLSRKACQELGIISSDFPMVGAHEHCVAMSKAENDRQLSDTDDQDTHTDTDIQTVSVNTIFGDCIASIDSIHQSDDTFHRSNNTIHQSKNIFRQSNSNFRQSNSTFRQSNSTFCQSKNTFRQGNSIIHQGNNIINQGVNNFQQNNISDPWTLVTPRRHRRRLQHQGGRPRGEGDKDSRYHTKYGSRGQLPTCAVSAT